MTVKKQKKKCARKQKCALSLDRNSAHFCLQAFAPRSRDEILPNIFENCGTVSLQNKYVVNNNTFTVPCRYINIFAHDSSPKP